MRLIDADLLQRHGNRGGVVHWQDIEDAPTVDIVQCGECKYASDNKVYGCMLNHFNDNDYHRMYADDFCSYGEREGE